jgi:hypothetical protein
MVANDEAIPCIMRELASPLSRSLHQDNNNHKKYAMNFFKSLFDNSRKQTRSLKHDQRPEHGDVINDCVLLAKMKELQSSSYFKYVSPLKELVVGKVVLSTDAGISGFILFFTDRSWVVVYLSDMKLVWEFGNSEIREDLLSRINSPKYGDGYQPLALNQPYADESCDIKAELINAVGRKIETIAPGENCFNFCFPNGMELDTDIVPTAEGKYALRVFWEQW